MFQPLMNRYHQKIIQYAHGLERVNEMILLNLALKEPETLIWDPTTEVSLKKGQLERLDPNDPITYRSYATFPQPLPLDKLIALNEIQSLLTLGLESKEGALRTLGEEFPAAKLNEIRQELQDDAVADGALKLIQTQLEAAIVKLTGSVIGTGGAPLMDDGSSAGGAGGGEQAAPPQPMVPALSGALDAANMGEADIQNKLVTQAFGTMLPQRRVPDEYEK